MKTWSLERAVVGFLSGAAVAVQGVLDAVRPPNFQPVGDAHPIPGCPDAVECRTHGCAGDCSEAVEYRTCPCGGTVPQERHVQMARADAYYTSHLCPGGCDCSDCFGNQDRTCHHFQTSQAVSADSSRDSAAESCSTPRSPSAACTDPSPTGDEGPAGDSAIPPTPPAGHLRQQQAMCPGCGALLDVFDREHAVNAVAEVFAALHADCLVDEEIADVIRRLFPAHK